MPAPILVYGAYGYTGRLVVRQAVAEGLDVVVAGRDHGRLQALAGRYGLPARVFDLSDPARLEAELAAVAVVLHCAGPFVETSGPMRRACLATGTHYLDVTGEIPVFEAVFADHDAAREAGVVLVPGVGFDVVPSDALAARVAAACPDPCALEIAFFGGAGTSRGTLRTMIAHAGGGLVVRRDGRLVRLPLGSLARTVEFRGRPRRVVAIPWGDVVTAHRTTKIPNVTVYAHLGLPRGGGLLLRGVGAAARAAPVRWVLDRLAARRDGPSEADRARARVDLWARCLGRDGTAVCGRATVPDGYDLTARTAVAAAAKVAAGEVPPGAWTPTEAFGPGFVESIEGVTVTVPAPC